MKSQLQAAMLLAALAVAGPLCCGAALAAPQAPHAEGPVAQAKEAALELATPANTNPLSVDPDLAIVTAIIFFILLAILWKFAWGPILEGLHKREQAVADHIAAAEQRQQQAQKLLDDYQIKLQRAGEEVRAMLEGARKDAESMKQSILAEAQKAAASEKERAVREIDAAKKQAISEVAASSVNLAFRVASDAVRREIKPEDHRTLVEDALAQFSSTN